MRNTFTCILRACILVGLFATTVWAAPTVPNSGGTAQMPLQLNYVNLLPGKFMIIDGLSVGDTIRIDAIITPPTSSTEIPPPGAPLTTATGNGMNFVAALQGTGTLSGFNRNITLPISQWIQNNNLRTPGNPIQSFDTDLAQLQSQITVDPDFDLLRITAGTNFGLPSPGHTTLTQSGSNWAVDSFFDVTYRIDFVGHPGGAVSGRSGSTTGTVRIVVPEPASLLGLAGALFLFRRRR